MDGLLQFVKFGFVGVSNSIVSYVIYMATLRILHFLKLLQGYEFVACNITQWVLSVLWSFYWNRKIVFKTVDNPLVPWKQALLKTYALYAFTGLFLNNFLSFLWLQVLGISSVVAPIINILIGFPINFLLSKFWAFRTSNKNINNRKADRQNIRRKR